MQNSHCHARKVTSKAVNTLVSIKNQSEEFYDSELSVVTKVEDKDRALFLLAFLFKCYRTAGLSADIM